MVTARNSNEYDWVRASEAASILRCARETVNRLAKQWAEDTAKGVPEAKRRGLPDSIGDTPIWEIPGQGRQRVYYKPGLIAWKRLSMQGRRRTNPGVSR